MRGNEAAIEVALLPFVPTFASVLAMACGTGCGLNTDYSCTGQLENDETALLQLSQRLEKQKHRHLKASDRWYPNAECQGPAANLSEGEGDGHFWRCNGGFCIYWDSHCDGKKDCDDGSDEFACGKSSRLAPTVEMVETQNRQLQEAITNLRTDNVNWMTRFADLSGQLSTLDSTLRAEFNALNVSLAPDLHAQADMDAIKGAHEEMQGKINAINNASNLRQRQVLPDPDLQATVDALKASNKAVRADLIAIKGDYNALHA